MGWPVNACEGGGLLAASEEILQVWKSFNSELPDGLKLVLMSVTFCVLKLLEWMSGKTMGLYYQLTVQPKHTNP